MRLFDASVKYHWMNDTSYETVGKDEIHLRDIGQMFWRHKLSAFVFIFGSIFVVAIASYLVPKEYEAATIIEPTSDTSNSTQSGIVGSIGGNLAALAGISGGADQRKTESVAVLQSDSLTRRYIQESNLMPILFADKWDAANAKWKVSDPKKAPTLWKSTEFFRKSVRSVITDSKTSLVTLKITWTDPVTAAKWANGVVKMTNDVQRSAAIAESERNIAYLSGEAARTDVLGIKQTIYSLLEREYNKSMLAKGNNQYAFKIIDEAVAAERPTYPNKLVWVLTAAFASFSIYLFVIFCMTVWSRR